MPSGKKNYSSTPKITTFTTSTTTVPNPLKRSSSQLSPPIDQKVSKKKTSAKESEQPIMSSNKEESHTQQVNIESLIEPIMQEFRSLKNTMATQQGKMSEGFKHLKSVLKEQKVEIISEINVKVDHNSEQIACLIDKNAELRRENRDR